MAISSLTLPLGIMLGTVLAGIFAQTIGWEYVNVLLAILSSFCLAMAVCRLQCPKIASDSASNFVPGLLLCASLVCVIIGLSLSTSLSQNVVYVLALVSLGIIFSVVFVLLERR